MVKSDDFERYALRMAELTEQGKKWVDVDACGADLGLSPHASRMLADYLCDMGWATTQCIDNAIKLRLVKAGVDEIALLRWPRWRRFLYKNPPRALGRLAASGALPGSALCSPP